MAAIILGMALLTPLFLKTFAAIAALSEKNPSSVQTARHLMAQVERYVVLMRIGGVVAVVLAVWKPTI